jgi:hypothetical protein
MTRAKKAAATDTMQPDTTQQNALLPLDVPRRVAINNGRKEFLYSFRRIGFDDWRAYYANIVNQIVTVAGQSRRIYETEFAALALVEKALSSVEGYGAPLPANWKAFLPPQHRLAVGMVLRAVGRSPEQPELSLSGTVDISLDATWSGSETEEGFKMISYSGLIHRFRHATLEQFRKFNLETAWTATSGTAFNGTTIYPSRPIAAMKVYDELIESVEGYSVDGKPLTDVEAIKVNMDGSHKATAALALFQGEDDVQIGGKMHEGDDGQPGDAD